MPDGEVVTDRGRAWRILAMNTAAFTVCFAVWMMYGVLVTFLVDRGLYAWDRGTMGWLIGVPVLSGAVMRLPVGVLTDRFGGRIVFTVLMLGAAIPTYMVSHANGFWGFLLAGLGFGLTGASFAVGVAYTSAWFPPEKQGTVLGIFGMGNMGAALTSMGAPVFLTMLTDGGSYPDGWRNLPRLYALALVVAATVFWLLTETRRVARPGSIAAQLATLRNVRVWRFGLYYFFAFGGFVALSQWLIPYYVNMYTLPLATAGLMAAIFSLPAGAVRAIGGWVADRLGARSVMYTGLGASLVLLVLLFPPRMDIQTPGKGVVAAHSGTVTEVSDAEIVVGAHRYPLGRVADAARVRLGSPDRHEKGTYLLPTTAFSQEPVIAVGDTVVKGQILARGVTHLYFQANVWIFSGFVLLLGVAMGCTGAAVYKHIPHYFPGEVGVVGGVVGVLGGLGGFVGPVVFGYLLEATGVWTSCWAYLFAVALGCMLWMRAAIQRMMHDQAPALMREIETPPYVTCPRLGRKAEIAARVEGGALRVIRCSLVEGETSPSCEAECLEGQVLGPRKADDCPVVAGGSAEG